MHKIKREVSLLVGQRLKNNPVVALLGPRQCGKSTLAKEYLETQKNTIYLDLESDQDRFKIKDIWEFFNYYKEKLICLDEIQRLPEIFSQIRSYVDQSSENGSLSTP